MLISIITALVTYFYLQWPVIVSALLYGTILLFVLWVLIVGGFYATTQENRAIAMNKRPSTQTDEEFEKEYEQSEKEFEKKSNKYLKILLVLVALNVFIPDQKTLGISVAVGATTYLTVEVVESSIVQKFIKMVTLQASTFLDSKIDALTTEVGKK